MFSLKLKTFSTNGFTLIELLVTISIIAILFLVGLVAYSSITKQARDSKRIADLKFIQSALEDYHADQLAYPTTVVQDGSITFTNAAGNVKTYLNLVPSDPLSSQSYLYSLTGCGPGSSTDYCLTAQLEGTNPPPSDPNCTAAPPRNFCVTRP